MFFEEGFVWLRVGLCERTGSALLLILHSSLHVGTAVLAATLSGRSRLIGHRRVGRHGCHSSVLRFRAMCDRRQPLRPRIFVRAEYINDCLGPELKIPDDVRISSRFAFFGRRSLDELPQLVHVAAGQMALVRPPVLIVFLAGAIPLFCQDSQDKKADGGGKILTKIGVGCRGPDVKPQTDMRKQAQGGPDYPDHSTSSDSKMIPRKKIVFLFSAFSSQEAATPLRLLAVATPLLRVGDHVRMIESTIGISVPERWRLDHDRYSAPFEIWLKDAANRWFPPVKAKVDAHQLATEAVSC
jgi:hypothetical protein